jgi:hypothetical protein
MKIAPMKTSGSKLPPVSIILNSEPIIAPAS